MVNHRSKKAKSLRAARQGKSVKKFQSQSGQFGSVWNIPKQIGFPDCTRASLKYTIPFQQTATGAGQINSLRMTSNAYDVDAALASTAMSYFSELAAVYSRFRTLGMRYRFEVSNQEAYALSMIYGFMTNSVSSGSLGQNYAGNPYMHSEILSPINGSNSTMIYNGRITTERLFGTQAALYDDLFTGSTTSSTLASSNTINCYIGSIHPVVPTNGYFVQGFIELDVLFFRRNSVIV